jgi:multisubunit Na+/H+ antiporter MnhG subunit
MCKKSFVQGLMIGLIFALIFMFLYNPVAAGVCVLALYLLSCSKNIRRKNFSSPHFSSYMQHGVVIVVITVVIGIFLVSPATALLGLALPLVGISFYRSKQR